MAKRKFHPGDWVVYRKTKHSVLPGPRAEEIRAFEHGDGYAYVVDKYWIVEDVGDDTVKLRTRRGKRHVVSTDDPALRPANWWDRLWHRRRFQSVMGEA